MKWEGKVIENISFLHAHNFGPPLSFHIEKLVLLGNLCKNLTFSRMHDSLKKNFNDHVFTADSEKKHLISDRMYIFVKSFAHGYIFSLILYIYIYFFLWEGEGVEGTS